MAKNRRQEPYKRAPCPVCGSSYSYMRLKGRELICRRCAAVYTEKGELIEDNASQDRQHIAD